MQHLNNQLRSPSWACTSGMPTHWLFCVHTRGVVNRAAPQRKPPELLSGFHNLALGVVATLVINIGGHDVNEIGSELNRKPNAVTEAMYGHTKNIRAAMVQHTHCSPRKHRLTHNDRDTSIGLTSTHPGGFPHPPAQTTTGHIVTSVFVPTYSS